MSRRIRVANVITRLQAGAGGVALRGCQALDPDIFELTVIAGSGDRLIDRVTDLGIEVILVPSLVPPIDPRRDLAAGRDLVRQLRAGRYDVVHTHSAKAGTLGRLAAIRAGVPRLVHTLHGFPFHEFQSRPRRSAYVAVERVLGRRTDSFLAVGSGVAAEAIRRGIAPPERIRTIGAAVDLPRERDRVEARRAARRRLDVPPGVRVIGTVGRLDYQKDPECFIDAIAGLGRVDVCGVWVGDGPLREAAERRIAERGLTERFRLMGDRADVTDLLPGFDVFALASRYEGLPCVIVEAMQARVPVVATAVNAVPDIVVPGETGLLTPPQRPAAMSAAINHLLEHPAEADRMVRTAADCLGDRFSAERLGAVLAATYAPLAGYPLVGAEVAAHDTDLGSAGALMTSDDAPRVIDLRSGQRPAATPPSMPSSSQPDAS